MVLSDGLVYFLKIENFFFVESHQNYLVAFNFQCLRPARWGRGALLKKTSCDFPAFLFFDTGYPLFVCLFLDLLIKEYYSLSMSKYDSF